MTAEGVYTRVSVLGGFGGLGVDPNNFLRLRFGYLPWHCRASCGGAWVAESLDGGQTWQNQSSSQAPYLVLRMYFSPANFDHALAPGTATIAHVTFDGGNQWLDAQGFGDTPNYVRDAAFASDGQTIWMVLGRTGQAPGEDPPPPPPGIYRSSDGGLNFQLALAPTLENPFWADARLYLHPTNSDVVYFSTASAKTQQSFLYRYDADLDRLTKQEWAFAAGVVSAVAFNPVDPQYLYLGFSHPSSQ
jgi:hypothetical protein